MTSVAPDVTPSTGRPDDGDSSLPVGDPRNVLDTDQARAWFRTELERNSRLIVERLEDTILAQLERRGGRFRGGF